MAGFGLDNTIVDKLSSDLNVDHVRLDQATDFFFLPQLNVIYEKSGDTLKKLVCSKLKSGNYAPRPPIEMEVPKRRRVRSDAASVIGPNYFRPGAVLYPEDRLVYHYIGQVAADMAKTVLDWNIVFSNRPLPESGAGFEPANTQWSSLKTAFESSIGSGEYTVVLRCDLAQYFFSIPLEWIARILLNPWLPERVARSVRDTLKEIDGCGDLAVERSHMIENARWKRAGEAVIGR